MLTLVVDILLLMLALYLSIGLIFSVYFLLKGAEKIDEGVKDSPWHFRLIIIPGVILMWSVLLIKMVRK